MKMDREQWKLGEMKIYRGTEEIEVSREHVDEQRKREDEDVQIK